MERALIFITILAMPKFAAGQEIDLGDGPESFGALAVGADLGYGGMVSAGTQAEADNTALNECQAVDTGCAIVARFGNDVCVAVAVNDGTGPFGWATGTNAQATADAAIDECVAAGGGRKCAVGKFACNGDAIASETDSSWSGSIAQSVVEQSCPRARVPPSDETCEAVLRRGQGEIESDDDPRAESCWIETQNQAGCWVFTDYLVYIWGAVPWLPSVSWSGDCVEGRAHGPGTESIEYYSPSRARSYDYTDRGAHAEGKRQGEWSLHGSWQYLGNDYRETAVFRDGICQSRNRPTTNATWC